MMYELLGMAGSEHSVARDGKKQNSIYPVL